MHLVLWLRRGCDEFGQGCSSPPWGVVCGAGLRLMHVCHSQRYGAWFQSAAASRGRGSVVVGGAHPVPLLDVMPNGAFPAMLTMSPHCGSGASRMSGATRRRALHTTPPLWPPPSPPPLGGGGRSSPPPFPCPVLLGLSGTRRMLGRPAVVSAAWCGANLFVFVFVFVRWSRSVGINIQNARTPL